MSILSNIVVITLWHYFSFKLTVYPDSQVFYVKDRICNSSTFLRKERFYENVFKIKLWKDKIPQYIRKNGFSKKNVKSLNLSYLKKFIAETYRAEINHFLCCLVIPLLFFINNLLDSYVFSFLVMLGNLPCVLIQRYNRFRLRRIILKINKQKF